MYPTRKVGEEHPINLNYLNHVLEYLNTFYSHLKAETPDARMFQYAFIYTMRITVDDASKEFENGIERISALVETLNKEDRKYADTKDINPGIIKSVEFANDALALWGSRYNYEYLLNRR